MPRREKRSVPDEIEKAKETIVGAKPKGWIYVQSKRKIRKLAMLSNPTIEGNKGRGVGSQHARHRLIYILSTDFAPPLRAAGRWPSAQTLDTHPD